MGKNIKAILMEKVQVVKINVRINSMRLIFGHDINCLRFLFEQTVFVEV